jgi:hypothetical protein
MELLKIDSHLQNYFIRNQFKLLIKYHENTLQNFLLVVLAILSLSSCSEDFLVKKPTEFVDYASATSTTENLYSLLNGSIDLFILDMRGKMKLGYGWPMQQVDICW